jgi:hypothetical protein
VAATAGATSLTLRSLNIFNEPLHQWEQLCLRSRLLLLFNWTQHLQIATVIQSIEESLLCSGAKGTIRFGVKCQKKNASCLACYVLAIVWMRSMSAI